MGATEEPAMVDLLKDVRRWRVERGRHDRHVGDSKSHAVERVHSLVHFGTHRFGSGTKAEKTVDSLPIAWLAEHVADTYNASHVHEDGNTA